MTRFICMGSNDTVATALQDATLSDTATVYNSANEILYQLDIHEDIPFGNKIAITNMSSGDNVIKYGEVIGQCTMPISIGNLVHVHNVKSLIADVPPVFKKMIMQQMNKKVVK